MIGGIFPVFIKEIFTTSTYEKEPPEVKCEGLDLRAFRWTQVMIYSIEEINKDPALLPYISLGYRILNSCASPTNTLRAALTLASGLEEIGSTSPCPPAISALIAESGSSQSMTVAGAVGPFQLPVSYFSTCACLSDRVKYPTFFRTIPSDYFEAKGLAALVKRFGWEWIGVIQSDNDYGRNGVLAFTAEVQKFGVCIAFVGTILLTYNMDKILNVVEMIKQSTVKVILAYVPEGDLYPLMTEIVKQNITGIQWLSTYAWTTAPRPSTPEIYQAFGGTLGFVGQKVSIPDLKPYLTSISPYKDLNAAFVRDFWEVMVTDKLQRVNFRNQFGDNVFFDQNGDPPAFYDIVNWHLINGQVPTSLCSNVCPVGTRKAQIKGKPTCCFDCIQCTDGTIANSTAECTPCPQEYWSNDRRDGCFPKTIEFLTYQEPMGIAVTVVSLLGVSLSLATMMIFIRYRETPVIKASNSELSCFLLFSLLLCFLCPLTFIGRPTVWTCMLRHTAFAVTFAFCISSVLGKNIVVVTAFKATFPGNNAAMKFGPAQQRIIVCSCTLIQILICILWLKLNPPFPDMVFRYSNKKIVLECNPGSEAAFYAVLGYIGLLAVICLVLAFLARKLPDNFNEAKFITFSMLIFCAVWITFIPAYISSPGKFTVAVETFSILSSAFGLLISIFAPKCYIIMIKPEKNTKKHVMGKI
ncbi:extracellular calcium-sensing receptor-like [Anabas testudineus]|uniref:extracellular calcium-sensing receptor-like n=1 Tax=Anabas testudineus TaxID=64144 RepID=UPI000E464C2B|nr:extracellular calcium-sensing receptor-like [Anabas testudineus]